MGLINIHIYPSQIDKRESDCPLIGTPWCLCSGQALVFWSWTLLRSRALDWAKKERKKEKESGVKPLWPHIRKMIKEATAGLWLLVTNINPQQMISRSTDRSCRGDTLNVKWIVPCTNSLSNWTVMALTLDFLCVYFIRFERFYELTDCTASPSVFTASHLECILIIAKRLFSICKTYFIQKSYT